MTNYKRKGTFVKKHTKLLLLCFSFCSSILFSQKETNNWYFGYGAGLDFNGGLSPLTNSAMSTSEGSASISDSNGNLLFYTEGDTIWNKNHQVMQNGTGMWGTFTTTQAAVIVQKPLSSNLYYVFSLGQYAKLGYSIVDINQNGGLGAVTNKNIFLRDTMTEKLAAVKHCNNRDIWIIAVDEGNDLISPIEYYRFTAFLLTPDGVISTPVITEMNGLGWVAFTGQLKASPNGKYLAWDGGQVYCRFDNSTGKLSNFLKPSFPFSIYGIPNYGVEFSPDSKFIYDSKYQININSGLVTDIGGVFGGEALQLASNGKIYGTDQNYMFAINQPNQSGIACNFQDSAIYLGGKKTDYGIPNFLSSYFYHPKGEFTYSTDCINGPVTFSLKNASNVDSVLWFFHDNNSTSKLSHPVHTFTQLGCAKVDAITYFNGQADTTSQCISISGKYSDFLGKDDTICAGTSIMLSVQYPITGKYLWSTGDTLNFINAKAGTYWVRVKNSCATFSDTIHVIEKYCSTESVFAPNVMTPNDDNKNDVFTITFSNPQEIQNVKCEIYDRWGVKVYTFIGSGGSWDGKTFDGGDVTAGVYYWVLNYSDSKGQHSKTGFIQLIR